MTEEYLCARCGERRALRWVEVKATPLEESFYRKRTIRALICAPCEKIELKLRGAWMPRLALSRRFNKMLRSTRERW